ncbi:PAS domain-containing protein [Falsiroseomonas tokyonensis]|uniref:PAS-domain containing protein n=1 Tax=Falsiroseomonas tokyonensis TaxID=430521 RepID=A0ABV7BQ12_9PROT|nr:PAS-domain containing protein [Falsiroseomonas tokyonensis]MBU8537693.1 PAS-domain containing protein [Falsiroseomonas tokyonensis]
MIAPGRGLPAWLALLLVLAGPAAAQPQGGPLSAGGSPWLWGLALLALILALGLGWALLRLRAAAARHQLLAAQHAELREVVDRAEAKARQLDGAFAAMTDGVMVTDDALRLVGWNTRFPDYAGVPRRALRIGMPLEEVLRLQAEAGEFGLVDPEAEVARRMQILRSGRILERYTRERPDGTLLQLRRAPLPGGGFVTLYTPISPATEQNGQASGLAGEFRQEWTSRAPRLMAAAADADVLAAQDAAHALRGIAANAGWPAAAALLAEVEAAARAGDVTELRLLTNQVPLDPPDAA